MDSKVKDEYKAIDDYKNSIRKRLSKRLGPYKKKWIDPNTDERILQFEKKIRLSSSKLKIYLRKRETKKALQGFRESLNTTKTALSKYDRDAFGLNPFCYISFTNIIAKVAFDRFHDDRGRSEFNDYFSKKLVRSVTNSSVDGMNEDDINIAYNKVKQKIEKLFDIDAGHLSSYKASSDYMNRRLYQFVLNHDIASERELVDRLNDKNTKFYKSFFDYIIFLNKFLEEMKRFVLERGLIYSNILSEVLQDWGDNTRQNASPFKGISNVDRISFDNLFRLSDEANVIIKAVRFRLRYLDDDFKYNGAKSAEPDCLFIIECFRNPYEADFFRSRYSEFYLVSITASKLNRKERVGKYFSQDRDNRDQGKNRDAHELCKLDVRSCVLASDISLINDSGDIKRFYKKFLRYFALMRRPGCIPPTDNELYMHIAYSHSLKSTCISRKVGAVILGPKGYILGAGWNDAGDGQIGCGLRSRSDLLSIDEIPLTSNEDDLLKFREIISDQSGDYFCYKDTMSKMNTQKKLIKFIDHCSDDCFKKISSELGIKRLEYCRALHAEENAILQSAKIGGMPIENGTIYTTTYPCELCAKKLYQIGIRTIYYTEPYPESISDEVFLEDGTKIIERIPFEGVSLTAILGSISLFTTRKNSVKLKRTLRVRVMLLRLKNIKK